MTRFINYAIFAHRSQLESILLLFMSISLLYLPNQPKTRYESDHSAHNELYIDSLTYDGQRSNAADKDNIITPAKATMMFIIMTL